MRTALLVALAVLLTSSSAPTDRALPAFTGGFFCFGVGLDATLAGDPEDPRVAWLVNAFDDSTIEAEWPPGSYARFAPELEVLLWDGTLFYREGDHVDGACYTRDGGPLAMKYSRYGTLPTR